MGTKDLQLTTWAQGKAGVDPNTTSEEQTAFSTWQYRYYAYDANGTLKAVDLESSTNVQSWGYKVVMTGNQSDGTPLTTPQLEALTNSKINLSVAGTGTREKVWVSESSISDGSNPIFTEANTTLQTSKNQTATLTPTGTYLAASDFANDAMVVGYVGIYIDGNNGVAAENSPLSPFGFTVTITGGPAA